MQKPAIPYIEGVDGFKKLNCPHFAHIRFLTKSEVAH